MKDENILEQMPINLDRDMLILKQIQAADEEKEKLEKEMLGKPIHLTPPRRYIKTDEYEKTIDELESEVAAVLNGDGMSEAEEVKLDLMFSMVLAERNGGPIVIKKDTAERIVKILQAVQEGRQT